MNNEVLRVKFEQRLNKLSSADYGNIESWMIIEAFNKAQLSWTRRQLGGINQRKEGAEGSIRKIDDLQFILTTASLTMIERETYWDTAIPTNYMEWCRISSKGRNCNCPARPLVIYETSESSVDILLRDENKKPSFEWATTFSTLISGTLRIYTGGEFDIVDPFLTYYRYPVPIQIIGVVNPATGIASTIEVECEAPDDVVELIIDEGVSILAGDIDDYQRMQTITQSKELNN